MIRSASVRATVETAVLTTVLTTILTLAVGAAWAHPTIVFGELTTDPAPPVANEPVEVRFTLHDPVDAPVEQAVVHLEARYRPGDAEPAAAGSAASGSSASGSSASGSSASGSSASDGGDEDALPPDGLVVSEPFEEVAPADYRTEVVLPYDGDWTVRLRDRTYRQEETSATLTLTVGPSGSDAPITFLFPPTAASPRSLATWLIWLIGLPLVAGAVVTVLVLRSSANDADGEDGASRDGSDRS